MKNFILLLFGVLISLPAVCQLDTAGIGRGQVYLVGAPIEKRGFPLVTLLKIKIREANIHTIRMGMDAVYVPESNVVGGNAVKSLSKLLTYQIPVSVQVSEEQRKLITDFITATLEPVKPPTEWVETLIDNTNTTSKYLPDWIHVKDATWTTAFLGKSASYTTIKDATITTAFTGSRVEWWTEKRVNHGIAAVSIDNGPEVLVDLYDKRVDNNTMKVFEKTLLTNGPHIIKIRVTGTKNPLASEITLIHDLLKVYAPK